MRKINHHRQNLWFYTTCCEGGHIPPEKQDMTGEMCCLKNDMGLACIPPASTPADHRHRRWFSRVLRQEGAAYLLLSILFLLLPAARGFAGEWRYAGNPPRGIALAAHGLNLKPGKMLALIDILLTLNIDAYNISLYEQDPRNDVQAAWTAILRAAYGEAAARALSLGVPLYFIGFSLGGLLVECLMNSPDYQLAGFSKGILVAPAIALNFSCYLVQCLYFLGDDYRVMSLAPPQYRQNPGTRIGEYKALFAAVAGLEKTRYKKSNIETLLFIDRADELVSYTGINNLIGKYHLDKVSVVSVSNRDSQFPGKKHHLIIDDLTAGTAEWQKMKALICAFLKE